MKRALLLILILAGAASAQSLRYDGIAIGPRGPVPGATIAVCTQPATVSTTPCSPLATLATSTSTSSGGLNPLTADALGNFHFYAAPNTLYTIQIYGPQINPPTVLADQTLSGGLAPGSLNSVSSINTVEYVGGGITAWSGSDIGAQINSAYAALPSTGGVIYVLPKTGGGSYTFSTVINFNTAKKPVLLAGVGVAGSSAASINAGVILEYTPLTAGCAVNVDYVSPSGSATVAHGFRDIAIHNGHTQTQGGQGSSATGICIGNTNGGMGFGEFRNVEMQGWGTAIQNNDTSGNSWGIAFYNAVFSYNTTSVNWGSGEEQTDFYTCKFTQSGTGFTATSGDVYFNTTSFDGNTVAHINANWTGTSNGSRIELQNTRFEFGGAIGGTNVLISGNGNWAMFGGTVVDDTNSGTVSNYFTAGGADATVWNTIVTSVGRTATALITANGNVRALAAFVMTASAAGSTVFNGTSKTVSNLSYSASNANAGIMWQIERGVTVNQMGLNLSGATAPTCAFTSGGGTSPSCTLPTNSTDSGGTIFATTGTGAPATTGSITLTFGQTLGSVGTSCVVSLNQAGAGQWNGRATVMPASTTQTLGAVFNWDNNAVNLTASTLYEIAYWCPGR